MTVYRKLRPIIIFILLWLVILAPACSRSQEIGQIKDAVLKYDQLLAEGYREMNMTSMNEVATKEEVARLYFHMAALGEAKVRLESELKRIEFQDVKLINAGSALVRTEETWDFKHVNYITQKIQLDEKGFIYNLVYELVKKDDKWLVAKVTSVPEEKTTPK